MSKNLFVIRPKGLNVGNDAIYLGLKELISRHFTEIPNIITIPATSKYEVASGAGLTASTIHAINQYGSGVIVGGGNLYENGELEITAGALAQLAPPMMLFSLSRGRIYDRNDDLVSRTDTMSDDRLVMLHKAASISVARDSATKDYLEGLGLRDIILGACPTIFLNRISDRLPEVPHQNKRGTYVSVRAPNLMNVSLRRQAMIHGDVRRIVELLGANGHKNVSLLCHDPRDIAFAASFGDIPYIFQSDPHDYLSLLNSASLLVSFRIHASLPALSFGTNFINISYDERAKSLMQTVGLSEWDVNLVEDKDYVLSVEDRLFRLQDLRNRLETQLATYFLEIDKVQNQAMSRFVSLMEDYDLGRFTRGESGAS